MTMTQHERNDLWCFALQQIYDALEAHHAPPFAAAFIEQFWQQIVEVVAQCKVMQPPDRITTLRCR